MNGEEVVKLRHEFGLLACAKQVKRERQMHAMDELLRKGTAEADIRAVVSDSASGWQRAKKAFRERHSLTPDASIGEAWMPLQIEAQQEIIRLSPSQNRSARWATSGTGWSWIRQIAQRDIRERLGHVTGPDVGEPYADLAYLNWREHMEENRARAREEMQSA